MKTLRELFDERMSLVTELAKLRDAIDARPDHKPSADEIVTWNRVTEAYANINQAIAAFRTARADFASPGTEAQSLAVGREARTDPQTGLSADALALWIRGGFGHGNAEQRSAGTPAEHRALDNLKACGVRLRDDAIWIPLRRCGLDSTSGAQRESRAQSALLGAGGGFAVPNLIGPRVELALLTHSPIRRLAEVITTPGGGSLTWPMSNDTTNVGSLV